jgi:modulator of FtsH protease
MHAYSTVDWEGLFLAGAGASAALAGLLFVAVSINLAKILQVPGRPGRAGEAIVLLVAVLVVSMLGLVPGQSPTALGAELLVAGLIVWLILVGIHVRAVRERVGPSPGVLAGRVVLAQLAVLPFLVAGVSLLVGAGGGLYWLVPGVVLCLVVAVLDAWVLLVEILR